MFYDRQGNPIEDTLKYGRMHADPDYKRVAETAIGPLWVSTVWLGIDMGFMQILADAGEAPYKPVIFETMVFPVDRPAHGHEPMAKWLAANDAVIANLHPELRDWVESQWRYSTEAEAIAGHDSVCVELRTLIAKIEMADEVEAEAIERSSQ